MSAALFYLPFPVAFTTNGVAAPRAQAYFYTTGTTTPLAVYTTSALSTQGPNPATADGAGRFADIYLDNTKTYRLVINDKDGAQLCDVDPYIPGQAPNAGALQPYADAASASASAASTSAGNAATSATNAASSASAASTSATSAADSASSAASSASSASSSLTAISAAIAPGSLNNASLNAATRVLLAGLSHASLLPALLTETGYSGLFNPSTANLATAVTNDPYGNVAFSSDPTGAGGAWVRTPVYHSVLHRKWSSALPTGPITLPTQFNNQLAVEPYWDGSAVQYKVNPYDLIDFTRQTTGTITFAGQPNNNDTVTLNGKTYTFQTTLTNVDGNIHIGASTSATQLNLMRAIMMTGTSGGSSGTPGTDYAAATTPHPTLAAKQGAGTTITLDNKPNGISTLMQLSVSATNVTVSTSTNVYYVSYSIGVNSGAGTSQTAPWKTLTYALTNAVSPAVIVLLDNNVGSNSISGTPSFNGNLKILGNGPRGRTLVTAMRADYTAADFAFAPSGSASAYVCTNATQAILGSRAQFDMRFRNDKGIPRPLTAAASIAACQATPGTFFYDSGTTSLYVYMWDGRMPDPHDGWIYGYTPHFEIQQAGSSGTILLENLEFCNNEGAVNGNGAFRYRPVTTGSSNTARVGLRNCLSFGSSEAGFQIYDASIACVDNCHVRYTYNDSFNYHSFITTGARGSWITIYETNCSAYESGFQGFAGQGALSTSTNCSTSHDSLNILRSGGRYGLCFGSVVADVNGVVSVNLDCHASRPAPVGGSPSPTKACYWHSTDVGSGTYTGMWLWGCVGNDDEDSTVNILDNTANGGGTKGQIYLKHWRGQTVGNVSGQVKDWAGVAL